MPGQLENKVLVGPPLQGRVLWECVYRTFPLENKAPLGPPLEGMVAGQLENKVPVSLAPFREGCFGSVYTEPSP